ncbi:MAG: isocitrate lyase/phosphoenolpyruvate mutase family protein [Alphaproteobacteria bacterium]|nr:isocitrate lyase/phosphoenolpyruvate mutase family protein [Alphaproteobacteria bacterium]
MSIFNEFLVLGNVWDVQSALSCRKLGFKAIGTSSAAVAASLGFEDGEDMPFCELLAVVKGIRGRVDLALTVDVEGGYSRDVGEIICNIRALVELGVVGINIEDSVVEDGGRRMLPVAEFGRIIGDIKAEMGDGVFLNARTDAYIMGLDAAFDVTVERLKHYVASGADGVFVPCVVGVVEIRRLVDTSDLPLNVMCMPDLPDLPDFEVLQKLGVKRISMGPFAYHMMVAHFERLLGDVVEDQSFKAMFG